jgi:flagellar biosynthesis component FlhA
MEHNHDHEEHIHMPAPSLSPIVLAAGMTFLGFAVAPTIFRIPFIVLGVLLTGYGLYTWIYDEVKNAASAEETGESHNSGYGAH